MLAAVLLWIPLLTVPAYAKSDEIKVKRVEISTNIATVRVNQTRTLWAYVYPMDADEQEIYWSTSNPEVVVVDGEGVITGVSPGTAEITATSVNGRKATCAVTVPGTVVKGLEKDVENSDLPESGVGGGEVLTAAVLRLDVEKAVSGGAASVTYRDKTVVSTAALRGAAYAAESAGGSVKVNILTSAPDDPADDWDIFAQGTPGYQGLLAIDPAQAGSEEREIGLGVYTSAEKTAGAREKAGKYFGGSVAAVRLAQQGSFGMTVEVAVKADLSGLSTGSLKLYSYDEESGGYSLLPDQSWSLDAEGYLHFSTGQGGVIVITDR